MQNKISNILKTKQTKSFEFFPPKDPSQEQILFDTVKELKPYNPDFVSITCGAGGSDRSKTIEWSHSLTKEFNVMAHLICYGNTIDTLNTACRDIVDYGIKNVLALRGDLPKDSENSNNKAFEHAVGLVGHIKSNFSGLCVAVAGYPETHLEAASEQRDITCLKEKIDAGAELIITQLFFDNDFFYRFKDNLGKYNINVPVIAGIMPIVNYGQTVRFTQMCGSKLPESLVRRLSEASDEDAPKIGEEYAVRQSEGLLSAGVSGIHYYTLNKSPSVRNILSVLNHNK